MRKLNNIKQLKTKEVKHGQMIDFKRRSERIEGAGDSKCQEVLRRAANDRKTGAGSTGYRGTVETVTGL